VIDILPSLPCPACGVLDVPHVAPGTGPHHAKAPCAHCDRFLKWVPRALVESLMLKEQLMIVEGLCKTFIIGTLAKDGVTVKYTATGTACACFAIVVSRRGEGGKSYTTTFQCEAYGKRAEAVSDVEPGAVVAFEGELRHRAKGEQAETIIAGFELKTLLAPVSAMTGHAH
jgi:single-stranded DNA-binding protein